MVPPVASPGQAADVKLSGTGSMMMTGDTHPQTAGESRSWLMRAWLASPDWLFRGLGVLFFAALLGHEVYLIFEGGFWEASFYWEFAPDFRLHLVWAKLLVLLTYLLIALAFVFRMAPRSRAARPREIVMPILGAFWPFLPLAIDLALGLSGSEWRQAFRESRFDLEMSATRFVIGAGCIMIGTSFDVWGYAVLFRSLSIVAEARELKTTGPYRIVRHPVYLGQIIAQGGVWLLFAPLHIVWILFYAIFVGLQLYRGRVEDEVLEKAFGEPYVAWKRKTFWFV